MKSLKSLMCLRTKNNVDNKIGDPDKKIDYQKIIRETKDEDYRKAVKVKKGGFVVIRKEDKNTKPIEEEQWYKDAKATGSEVILEDTVKDDNGKEVKQVSYKITTEEKDIWSIVDNTNNQNAVEIAEPVYKYYTSEESVPSAEDNKGMEKQWYLKDQKLESVWGNEKVRKYCRRRRSSCRNRYRCRLQSRRPSGQYMD